VPPRSQMQVTTQTDDRKLPSLPPDDRALSSLFLNRRLHGCGQCSISRRRPTATQPQHSPHAIHPLPQMLMVRQNPPLRLRPSPIASAHFTAHRNRLVDAPATRGSYSLCISHVVAEPVGAQRHLARAAHVGAPWRPVSFVFPALHDDAHHLRQVDGYCGCAVVAHDFLVQL
jgi:hypothetical protein